MRKKFERSTDLLVKSNTLPAELLISQMSVSKLRNYISLLKSDGTESFSLSGNVLVRKNNRTEQLILLIDHYKKEASKNGTNFRVKSGLSDQAQSLNAC